MEPPFLETLAMISVFSVALSTSSLNTTILLVVGALPAVNAFEIIVVDCATVFVPVMNTYPSSLASPSPEPQAAPSPVPATYKGLVVPPLSAAVPSSVEPDVICGCA